MEDALAFGGACISLLNYADRVKAACLAQLVNVIAPIMTEKGGPAWRQTIFHPFAQMSRFGRGRSLRLQVECETYAATYYDPRGAQDLYFPIPSVPFLKMAAVADERTGGLSLFLLNRDLEGPMDVSIAARGFDGLAVAEALQLHHPDLQAANSKNAPERIQPTPLEVAVDGTRIDLTLPPASWAVVSLAPPS